MSLPAARERRRIGAGYQKTGKHPIQIEKLPSPLNAHPRFFFLLPISSTPHPLRGNSPPELHPTFRSPVRSQSVRTFVVLPSLLSALTDPCMRPAWPGLLVWMFSVRGCFLRKNCSAFCPVLIVRISRNSCPMLLVRLSSLSDFRTPRKSCPTQKSRGQRGGNL